MSCSLQPNAYVHVFRCCVTKATICLLLLTIFSACSNDNSKPLPSMDVSVNGTVTYEDKLYGAGGFTGSTVNKTLRYAIVDLVNVYGTVVNSVATDGNGHYSLQGRGPGLYVRVLAQTSADAGTTITISSDSGDIYAITQTLPADADGTVKMDFPVSLKNRIAGVFNMLDVYTNASLFVSTMSTSPLPAMNVYWQSASEKYGTYFCPSKSSSGMCPQGKGVYIIGGTNDGGDTDEYDDDVLMHEYGHYIETTLGVRDSPGGVHYLTQNDEDLRLAWSEGWGGFFPDALKHWLKANNPSRLSSIDSLPLSYYVDTYGNYAGVSIDMASPSTWMCSGGSDCFHYSSSEVAVAKLLSGMEQAFGMQAIWDVLSGYMRTGTSQPASLETFWDGWLQQRAPDVTEQQQLQNIFSERQVYYQTDNYESDNSLSSAHALAICNVLPCIPEQHTFYGENQTNDSDVFSVALTAGKTYNIETLHLGNGADTYLRLLDSSGNVVTDASGKTQVDDNRPGTTFCYPSDNPCRIHYDDTMLSSALNFSPTRSGTYYVEVKTSPNHPAGAGRYGTYSIQVRQL